MSFDNSILAAFPAKSARLYGVVTNRLPMPLLLTVGVVLVTGIQLSHFLLWPPQALIAHGMIHDDAFFYSVLARNFKTYGFLTFDGLTATNGIQPLWMAIQILLSHLFSGIDEAVILIRASWVCYSLFAGLTMWWLASNISPKRSWVAGLIMTGLVLGNVQFQAFAVRGLETPVMLLTLIVALILIDQTAKIEPSKIGVGWATILAASTVFCFFARTNLFWIVLITGGWLVVRQRRFGTAASAYFGCVAMLVLPYLIFNLTTQSSIIPISGRVKLFYLDLFYPTWSEYYASDEWQGFLAAFTQTFFRSEPFNAILPSIIIVLSALAFCFTLVWQKRSRPLFPVSIRILSLVAACHLIFMHVFYQEVRPYTSYYFAPEIIWLAAVFSYYGSGYALRSSKFLFASDWFSKKNVFQFVLSAFIIIGSMWVFFTAWVEHKPELDPRWQQRIKLAADIARLTPDEASVAAIWPGLFAQLSNKPIIPLDGIVSSNGYFEAYVKPGRQLDYVREKPHPYLAIYLPVPLDKLPDVTSDQYEPWNLGLEEKLANEATEFEVIAFRPIIPKGAGWYLIKLEQLKTNDEE